MSGLRIVVADNSALLRTLLAYQISREADMEVVGQAADGRQAIVLTEQLAPDVILIDLDMPVMTGSEAAEHIRAHYPSTGILLLTSHEALAPEGELAGAVECLVKSCTPGELVAAIRRAARG